MNKRAIHILLAVASLGVAAAGYAQEGHPLTGTWSGDWGAAGGERTRVTFVLTWDGDKVTGIMNPGPDSSPVRNVFVDYANWTVRIETDRGVAEGRLEDIGSKNRSINGTWRQGTTTGDFRIRRD
jgi:hypothetical protein